MTRSSRRSRRLARSHPYGSRLLGPADQSSRSLRVRVQVLLTAMLVVTNLIGAVLVFVISTLIVPTERLNRASVITLAIAVPAYVAVAGVVGATIGTLQTVHALRWTLNGETPDDEDRRRTLQAPLRLTLLQFGLWVVAAVLFTLLALVQQPARALTTALTVGSAAIVVSGVAYLLATFALRPVAARALVDSRLRGRPRGAGIRARALIFWSIGTGVPVTALMIGAVIALADPDVSTERLAGAVIVVGAVVLVFGLLVTYLNTNAVVDPVLSVRDAMLDVERGQLDRQVVVYDGTELGMLQAGFNQMAGGLRERERLRDLFGRHVGREVAQQAAEALGDVELGGESRSVTVLFVDLAGSTTYAAENPPAEVVDLLNRFFGVVVDEVDRRGGLVNKFVGDAVLAVFGAPVALEDHAARGLSAARAMAARLVEELPEIAAGVGVATGEVVVGNVGHEERFEYTVIGDAVNCASRLTDLAKDVEGRVLASMDTVESAGEEARHWREDGSTTLRGRTSETRLAVPSAAAGRS